jgi:uracil-DNA glycosylase family 4
MVAFKRTKCQCSSCPLDGNKKIASSCDIEKFTTVLIGDSPDSYDEAAKQVFSGSAGALLKGAIARVGLMWHSLYKMNVVLCKAPKDDSFEAKLAYEACLPGFKEEIAWIEKQNARVLIPLGPRPLEALGMEGKIQKVRGSIYTVGKLVGIPTFHPKYILAGMWHEEPTWVNDFAKARELSLKKYVPLKEKFNVFPTLEEVEDFAKEALAKKTLLGVDIETTSLNPEYSQILMIGFAKSAEEALVVPFTKKGGAPYWSSKEFPKVQAILKKLLKEGRLVFQNAPFDTWHLEMHGYPCCNVEEDTMLLHHVINPELPHNLGYIVSVYGRTPFWKDVVLGNADKMIHMDDEIVRTYNARDCVVLLQVLPEMHKHLKDVGTEKIYREVSLKLIKPLRKMSMFGLPLDAKAIEKKKRELTKKEAELREDIFTLCELPSAFNLSSGDQLRYLLFGITPVSYSKALAEKEKIDSSPKGRKDTKKYRELLDKVSIFTETEPLYKTSATQRKTEGGSIAVDSEALISIQRAALNRLSAIESIIRRKESHAKEEGDIKKLLAFCQCYHEWSGIEKLRSTFSGFPIGRDGRVHPSYKIHGTTTGRLSSSEPNAQNIPAEVQDVFVAPKGRQIIKADYSNIELRVLAYITGEEILIEAFESGKNIHDLNCKLLFGIEESNPIWKVARRAAKVFVFGRSYGGSVEGIYKQLVVAVPELGLTLEHFKKMDKNYFATLTKYKEWVERMQRQARNTRCVESAFGRKRFLLGTPSEIERMALNTPIQGTAGEVTLRAIIELDSYLESKFPSARMIGTVHDSILIESDKKDTLSICKAMKKIMEKPYIIEGRKVQFPIDIEVGSSWGTTELVVV